MAKVSRTQVVKFTRSNKGEQGATLRGPQEWDSCATGYAFQAGKAGEQWKDVVVYNGNYYSCLKAHIKTADNYPGSPNDQNNGLWQLGDKIELVASKLLLASYAIIKNLGVEAIEMKDKSGKVVFKAKDGEVTCDTGTFNNIAVKSGEIAGFKISGDGLTNEPFKNDAYIIFRNDQQKTFAGIGGNVLPSVTGARGVARFENHDETDKWGLGLNFAAVISAQGARDSRAIQLNGGSVCGFAMRNIIIGDPIGGVQNLTRDDYNIIATNSRDLTLVLPIMQLYDDGHVVRIKRLGAGALKLRMADCYTYLTFDGRAQRSRPVLVHDWGDVLTGDDTLEVVSPCDAMELVWCRDLTWTKGSTTYHGAWLQYILPRTW